MLFMFFMIAIAVIVVVVVMVRGFNYNHRIGEGMFKNSEYNLDEPDDFVDKNYYDETAFRKFVGKDDDKSDK